MMITYAMSWLKTPRPSVKCLMLSGMLQNMMRSGIKAKRINDRTRAKNMPNLPGFGNWIISAENRPSQSPTLKSTKQQTGIKYLVPHSLDGLDDLAKTVMAGKQARVTTKIRKTLIP